MTTAMPAQPTPTSIVNHPGESLSTATSDEPAITSYAKAPARTITAGGVTRLNTSAWPWWWTNTAS